MIGFCLVADPAAVTKIIKEKAVSWPQVVLRDRKADSIVLEYAAAEVPKLFLIAPDGKVVGQDLGEPTSKKPWPGHLKESDRVSLRPAE